jgi:branched-chain amino acid transport system substrate-binding protein
LRLIGCTLLVPASGLGGAGGELTVGALLSLSGDWSTLGKASKVLLESAVADTNRYLADTGSALRVRLLVEDTALDPTRCASAFQRLRDSGAAFVIGPQSSSEVRALQQPLDGTKVVVISQGSTASSLSLEGDHIYRFVPDDTQEAEAVVALAQSDAVRTLLPIWRADAGNRGLVTSVRRLATEQGLSVLAGIEYPSANASFSEVVRSAAGMLAQRPEGKIAIYLAAFDEIVDLFHAAQPEPMLSGIRWYGSDGVALSAALADDPNAADYARRVQYVAPTLGLPDRARAIWEPLSGQVREAAGVDADAFAMAAFDAYWCALFACLTAGTPDLPSWRPAFANTADFFFGATGWGTLNAAGDRRFGDFDFWALSEVSGKTAWARVLRYEAHTWGGGTLVNLEVSK